MKNLNRILLYCLMAIISYCFYGCGEEEIKNPSIIEDNVPDKDENENGSKNENEDTDEDDIENEIKPSISFINESESYLSDKKLTINFTHNAEEKTLSFISELDWSIKINLQEAAWLTISIDDETNTEITQNNNELYIKGIGSKNPYTIRFKTNKNIGSTPLTSTINISSENKNGDKVDYNGTIIQSVSLVENHNIHVSYAGGAFPYKFSNYLYTKTDIRTDADWIHTTNHYFDTYNYDQKIDYYKIDPNKTNIDRYAKIAIKTSYKGYNNIDTIFIKQIGDKKSKLINVSTAGNLHKLLTPEEKFQITDLTITGDINSDDIRYIREMAGKDYANNMTNGVLVNLDISNVNIKYGGKPYMSDFISLTNCIDYYMFSGLNLNSIELPNSVTNIGDYIFKDCINIQSIKLPHNLKIDLSTSGWDDSYIFTNCINLTQIEIPEGVKAISGYMFSGCTNIESIKLPDEITTISRYAFYRCNQLVTINIPNKVKAIEYGAFSWCSNLKEIILPDCLETIKDHAFSNCTSLKEITLPANVNTLGEYIFRNCTNLTKIHYQNPEPPLCSGALGIEETATLYVPTASLEKYKDAAVWKNFKNIVGE